MKNLIVVGAMLTALTAVSFAAQKKPSMQHQYYEIQKQMVDDEIESLQRRMKHLTAYQRALINMMNNEGSTHAGGLK